MPSPFPGMDPYLESPLYWQDFHESFIPYSRDYLQPRLLERYRARIGERLVIESTERPLYPDLAVVQRPEGRVAEAATVYAEREVDIPAVVAALPDMWGEAYIEIIDRAGERVVTVVELLSPSNKIPGDGHNQYLERQRSYLSSGTNLIEIDLLREGVHTVAAPRVNLHSFQPLYSVVSVWRAVRPQSFEVYPVRLQHPLPNLRVPLLPEDKDVTLDIQAIFTECYDKARYDRDLDYSQPPPVKLPAEEAAWVDAHLRERGARQ